MMKSKKAVVHTWFDYAFAIVGGILIFVVGFFVVTSGSVRVDKEIRGHRIDIKSEEVLVSYLSSYVSKDAELKELLGEGGYRTAERLSDSRITFADLIVMAAEDDNKRYAEILQKETEYFMNRTFGGNDACTFCGWKIDIKYPDGKEMSYGGFKGETRVYELKIPSTGYNMINIKLTVPMVYTWWTG